MDQVVRLETIKLRSADQSEEFESFARHDLFPTLQSAYGGFTRVTIASLVSQVLLKRCGHAGEYVWLSLWSGPAQAVEESDLTGASMTFHKDALARLQKLEEFS